MRTWFEAKVTSDGLTPGRPPSPSRRIAVARDRPAPNRNTIIPSSREIDETPGRLGRQPQLRHLDQALDLARHRAEAIRDVLAERRQIARRPRPRQSPVQLEFLRLVGDVVVRQPRLERDVHDRLRDLDDRRPTFMARLLRLHRLGQHPRVEGHWEDALFIAILVANSGIGIFQEWRAKNALDRLAALVAPHATVVRDGRARPIEVEGVVPGDLIRIEAGDQLVADGVLTRSDSLRVDESILTGESRAVERRVGEDVRSGSFAVEGSGFYAVTAVGEESYAARLADIARTFRHPRSPLERSLNQLLLVLVAVMVPLGAILGYALYSRSTPFSEAVPIAVAAVVTLVPEGLILLTSLTYAVAAVRMARRGALAQQLNAVESLASVEVICLDKTGTLTEAALRVIDTAPLPGIEEEALADALGRYAASSPSRNATLEAIADAFTLPAEPVSAQVPFSSRRRWSAARLGTTAYVLGAPELFELDGLSSRAAEEQAAGRRVVALGTTSASLERIDVAGDPDHSLPPNVTTLGLVVLGERLRPDAKETVQYFLDEGVKLVVISGDAPRTVAAIAEDAGIPMDGEPLDGRELPGDPEELREAVLKAGVVGRISPEGKQRVIEALHDGGHYVAMVGDGVNDVPALKAARLAIAQGTGSQMAKSVADLVLVNGDFAAVPPMLREGRKVLRNLQRVTKLFVAKSAFAVFLILTLGLAPTSYPVLPRHLTLAATLTIGIPAFFLALAPSDGPWRTPNFLREVARFAIPAGTAAGLGVVSSFLFAHEVIGLSLPRSLHGLGDRSRGRRPLPRPRSRGNRAEEGPGGERPLPEPLRSLLSRPRASGDPELLRARRTRRRGRPLLDRGGRGRDRRSLTDRRPVRPAASPAEAPEEAAGTMKV